MATVSNSGGGSSMGDAQQGTRGLSAGDWTRIQRLRQNRTYATTLVSNKDIAPTPFPQFSQHMSTGINVFYVIGTSKIRRPASSWTDYVASQTADFILSSQSDTTGTAVKNVDTRLCDCSPAIVSTKTGNCTKCNALGTFARLRL
jgi:hypothetical protein